MDVPGGKSLWDSMMADEITSYNESDERIVVAVGRQTRVSSVSVAELLNRLEKLEEAVAEMHILGENKDE